jgi:hypothetical protein
LEAHKQCNRAISTIAKKASHTLTNKLREKEDKNYGKSPKHYHINIKISADVLLRARYHPRVVPLTNPIAKTTHNKPQEGIDVVTTNYVKE